MKCCAALALAFVSSAAGAPTEQCSAPGCSSSTHAGQVLLQVARDVAKQQSTCVAKDNNQNIQDETCQPCAGGYAWWPCNTPYCDCSGVPPTTTTTTTGAPGACVALANNQNIDAGTCEPCAGGYTWWPCNTPYCDCSGTATTTPATGTTAAPTTTTTVAPTTPSSSSTTVEATVAPSTSVSPTPGPVPSPPSGDSTVDAAVQRLEAADSANVFLYDTGAGWVESDIYKWSDMVEAVRVMALEGIGDARLWLGGSAQEVTYGLVNIAAFLAQCMQETIQYNACDENNWSDQGVVSEAGGTVYSATSACGQLHQSYQNYECSAEENELAGGQMACSVDPDMELRAHTQAGWYGAPPKLFCAPRSKIPNAPKWNYQAPWCNPADDRFDDTVPLESYFEYVRAGGSCKDYPGIKAGGWEYCDGGACPGSDAPQFGQPAGRTDVEGCCWWGRGVIQTTGVCNYGKLNYYMGKRAADEGRSAMFPTIDFCREPGSICAPGAPGELKWVAGFFYWLNAVQPYEQGGWNYIAELKKWVDAGMPSGDNGFINGASGIVNRGCHNPPNCGTGELHAGEKRIENFRKVLTALGI